MTILVLLLAAEPAPQCRQIHYLEDGRIVESRVPDTGSVSAGSSSASSAATGGSSAHSSVSARSTGNGAASSSVSSTSANGQHRSVSVTRDARGCTITIDERPPKGEEK